MTNLVYAIKVNELIYSGLRVLDVKIGKTKDIQRTLRQYRRSGRGIEILDLWEPNSKLTLSQCEVGVQSIAEQYAYSKESEKFIFLQDRYDEFSDNVSKLLKKASPTRLAHKRVKKSSESKWIKHTENAPKYIKFKNKNYKVTSWNNAIQTLAKQLYDEVDDFNPVLKLKGQRKIYFAKRKDKLMRPMEIHDTPYYFEGKNSTYMKKQVIKKLLNTFGYDESDLEIGFE